MQNQLASVCRVMHCLAGAFLLTASAASAGDVIVVRPDASPGMLQLISGETVTPLHVRPAQLEEGAVGQIRTVTRLNDGRTYFASGQDKFIYELTADGERRETTAAGQVQQIRSDGDCTLFYSCLLTAENGDSTPEGAIFARDLAQGEDRKLLSLPSGDLARGWRGAFDVQGDRVLIGQPGDKTQIFDITAAPPKLFCTLPLPATSFLLDQKGGLFACDGGSQLWHFTDPAHPEESGVSCEMEVKLIDFAFVPEREQE